MSSRDSRSHNDSRANRLPYHPEPRQGRFGRVENWREAEERRQEEIRRQRRAHSRSAHAPSQQATQAAQQQAQRQGAQGAADAQHDAEQEALRKRAAARHEARKMHPEVNPWQQGRFGRVENWGDVERRRRQQEQVQAQAEAQSQSERQVRKTPTQQHVEELEKQRTERKAQQQEQAAGASLTKGSTASQARAGQAAHAQRAQGAEGSAQDGAQASATEQPKRPAQGAVGASGEYRQPNRGALSRAKAHLSRPQALHSASQPRRQQAPVQSQAQQAAAQQQARTQRSARQQQGVATTSASASFKPSDKVANYSRDSYTSSGGKSVASFMNARPGQGFSARRTTPAQPTGQRSSVASKITQIPKKFIVIAAVVFAIVIILGVGFSCSQPQEGAGGVAGAGGGTQAQASLPTPIMSESSGVLMHSAVAMEDLTEILIHNASYAYANEITTRLAEATNTDVLNAHGTGRIASTQPTGDNWMTGEFIRCFRSGNAGPIMSAIDCGGPVGATVYAPVTGEVVMVKEYDLYGEIDDFRVHIQPTGRPDLDVVLIHLTDVTVKPGDKVTAGVTPIAKIRDIYQYLDESLQLKNYTAESDNGNHTHIQVNDATHPEYTALDELKPQPVTPPAQATPGNAAATQ